ncbi:MAG: hypothetical protein ABSG17_23470 [Spirochaetia bacterium]
MRRFIPLLLLFLPAALFAQTPKEQEAAMLKKLGLGDSQIMQVLDIQNRTQATVRQDRVELQLLHAQMEKALLPSSPNMQEVNGYIAQMAQIHADMAKALIGARVVLRQIVGEDNFPVYSRFMMHRYDLGSPRGMPGMRGQTQGGMMGGDGPMMGEGNAGGSMMGGPVGEDE